MFPDASFKVYPAIVPFVKVTEPSLSIIYLVVFPFLAIMEPFAFKVIVPPPLEVSPTISPLLIL